MVLGIILGLLGAFYNWFTLKVQSIYSRLKMPNAVKLMIPFMCAGVLAFTASELLGNGFDLIEQLTTGPRMMLGTILFLLIGRFIFSAVSFGPGSPGGIFFPLLVIGGFIGGAFSTACTDIFGITDAYINNFILIAMAGYFAAIVRAPLTGIILLFEMSGTLNNMLSLTTVSVVAYIVATLLGSKPIYESLLERFLSGRSQKDEPEADVKQKVLSNFVIEKGSQPDGVLIRDVSWPDSCLLVSIQRGAQEIIPRGSTQLMSGDIIVTMMDERDMTEISKRMEELCEGF